MTAVAKDGETDDRQEGRSLWLPSLIPLALAALLVVTLAGSLFWTGRQAPRTDAALARSLSAVIAAVLVPAVLALLALGGYRGWAGAQHLAASFAGQIGLRQEKLDALRRRHFFLSAALSGIGDAVIAADAGGRITFLNPVAEALTVWHEEDAVGREVKAVLTLVDERTGAALADPAGAILASSLRLEFPAHTAQVSRTGERRPVTGSGTPIWEEDGRPGGVALVFRDVSERRGAAEALRDVEAGRASSEARAEAILESALDCVVLVREGGEIAGFNPAAERAFGRTSAQAMGRPAAGLLFAASARDKFRKEMQRAQAAGEVSAVAARAETSALRADGREFPAEMTVTQVPRQEEPLFAVHLRDISDRREAEEALGRAQEAALTAARAESREKSALLANMSDELRTPLNAVIGYSEMLQEEAHDRGQGDLVPDLQKIHGAGRHLLALINDILDLSKIEAGQMELYPETFEVAAMLDEVTGAVQPTLAKNENTLQVRAAGDLGVMRADRSKVKQSLLNLLSNAAGFSHGRTVTLEASREQDRTEAWITFRLADAAADQGRPLSPQLLEGAPDLPASGAPRFSGHGLALVIARRVCQMQGGEFTGSREPGQGAVYRLRFPAQ